MSVYRGAERRKSDRTLTFRTGIIVASDAAATEDGLTCAVVDQSSHGACVLVPKGTVVPPAFALVLDGSGERLECEVKWQAGCRVGVETRRHGRDPLEGAGFRLRIRAQAGQAPWRYAVGRGLIATSMMAAVEPQ